MAGGSDFRLQDGLTAEDSGPTATSTLTPVPTPATANTKSAWVQLIASTARDYDLMVVDIQGVAQTSVVTYSALVDIGIGAAGSEGVILPNLWAPNRYTVNEPYVYQIPICVPSGQRIAARAQSAAANQTVNVSCGLFGEGFASPEGLGTTVGCNSNTANSLTTILSAPASTNTKSAWTQLTGSLPLNASGVVVAVASMHTVPQFVDIGIGAAGSEIVVVPNIAMSGASAANITLMRTLTLPLTLPYNTRVAARYQASSITSPPYVGLWVME